ncbi:hypothetical protein F4809DRAFT_656914 [Biscogniauxia mediterranea]|nr:hypothetical protein F4809DRAFT_656914 [Biscogniauxia mediterranea]
MAKEQSPESSIRNTFSHSGGRIASSDQTIQLPSNKYGVNVRRLGPHNQHQFSHPDERIQQDHSTKSTTDNTAFTSSSESNHFLTSPLSMPESGKRITRSTVRNQRQKEDERVPGLSMDSRHSINLNPVPGRPSRFIEDLDSLEVVVPPARFMDHENRSSYTLVNSHNSSIAAASPAEKPSTPRRSERLAKKHKQAQAQAQQKQRQHRPAPLQLTSRGASTSQQPLSPSHTSSSPATATVVAAGASSSRTLPSPSALAPRQQQDKQKSPYFRLRDSQGRPTAYALDRCPGRYPITDPRSINNVQDYPWLQQQRRRGHNNNNNNNKKGKRHSHKEEEDEADLQRRGSPRYPAVAAGVRVELVPVRCGGDDDKKTTTTTKKIGAKEAEAKKKNNKKNNKMWVAVAEAPGPGGWKEINWGGRAPSSPAATTTTPPGGGGAAISPRCASWEEHCITTTAPTPTSTSPSTSTSTSTPAAQQQRSTSLKRKRHSSINSSSPASPTAVGHKSLSQRLRSWLARRRMSSGGRSGSSSSDEEQQQQESPYWTPAATATTTATTVASRASLPPPPAEELEADEEAREMGPGGERKYGAGEYAAVVALGSIGGGGGGCGGAVAASVMMSRAPEAWMDVVARQLAQEC